MRLARKVDASVLLFWPRLDLFYDNATAAGDIFDPYRLASPPLRDRLQVVDGHCRNHIRFEEVSLDRRKVCDPSALVVGQDADPSSSKLPVVVGHWEGPLLTAGETRHEALAEMPSVFAELPIRHDLMAHIERVDKTHKLYRMVAVHIRRGDIVRNLREAVAAFRPGAPVAEELLEERIGAFARRCMSLENFAAGLQKFVEEGRTILVFSDEPGVHEDLARVLGTPDVVSAASLAPGGLTAMQQAFVEVCLMGRCRCVVGARSAYSRLGAVIGGARHEPLTELSRTAEDCASFALRSVSGALVSHPHRARTERFVQDAIVRLRTRSQQSFARSRMPAAAPPPGPAPL